MVTFDAVHPFLQLQGWTTSNLLSPSKSITTCRQQCLFWFLQRLRTSFLSTALRLVLSSRRGLQSDGPRYSTAMLGRFRWTLGGTYCSHWQLTVAGSTRQTFSFRDSCTLCAWEKGLYCHLRCQQVTANVFKILMVPLSHIWLRTLVGLRNILLKAQICFWNNRILQANMSMVQWHAARLYIVSIDAPNFWLEASLSNTSGSPQRHVLPQVSPYFWNCSKMVCPLQCSPVPLFTAAHSFCLQPLTFWWLPGKSQIQLRDFLKQTVYIWLILPVDLKKPLSWLTKVTESQKFITNNSNTLQLSSKKWRKSKTGFVRRKQMWLKKRQEAGQIQTE